jgi:hypothetical protein
MIQVVLPYPNAEAGLRIQRMDPAGDDQLDNSGWRAFISKSGASARGRFEP